MEGEKPPCSSQRSDPKEGPWAIRKFAAGLTWLVVERGIREPELLRHQDREGDLVELRPERVGRGLAVDEAVSRHRAVRQLLALEQEQRRVARGVEVAVGEEARPRLVEVAGEDLAIGAEVGVRRVAGRDRLTPRRGEAGHDRAGEGLVLGGLEDVRAQVVLVLELVDRLLAFRPVSFFGGLFSDLS